MVDQRLVEPLGMTFDVVVNIGGINFLLSFIVIPMVEKAYAMLLGQPWLKGAKILHDWAYETMTITTRGQNVQIRTNPKALTKDCQSMALEARDEFLEDIESRLMDMTFY